MSSYGEHRTLIFVGTFLAIFVLMISQIPSIFYAYQTYVPEEYTISDVPTRWDTANIGKAGVKSQDYKTVDMGAATSWFALTHISTNDTLFTVDWEAGAYSAIYIAHSHSWWQKFRMLPYELDKEYVLSLEDENTSALFIRCETGDIPEVFLQISYDNSTYDSLSLAWTAGHLEVWMGFLLNASSTKASYDVWTLLGQIMFFQAPYIEPTLNAIIAIPIWISIIVCIIYVLDKVMPF
jgi:hypothetical protein